MFEQTNESNSAPKLKAMYVFMKWALYIRSIVANFAAPTAVRRPLFQAKFFSSNTLLFRTARGTSRSWRTHCFIRCIGYRFNEIAVVYTTLIPETLILNGMNRLTVGHLIVRHREIVTPGRPLAINYYQNITYI
jgi:hypothetical protein